VRCGRDLLLWPSKTKHADLKVAATKALKPRNKHAGLALRDRSGQEVAGAKAWDRNQKTAGAQREIMRKRSSKLARTRIWRRSSGGGSARNFAGDGCLAAEVAILALGIGAGRAWPAFRGVQGDVCGTEESVDGIAVFGIDGHANTD